MRKRQLLLRGASAFVPTALAAGCAEKTSDAAGTPTPAKRQTPIHGDLPDLPVEERWDVLERTVETAARADVENASAFEAAVKDGGPKVSSLKESKRLLELKCVPETRADRGLAHDVGHVAGTYAAFVRSGATFVRLDVTVEKPDGDPFGSFQVLTEWADRYERGAWSAKEYGEAALGTLKTKP